MLVTTPIFYVNARPHLGHAYSMVLADALCRWNHLKAAGSGRGPVCLSTGTDEHGQKIMTAARDNNSSPLEWCTRISSEFRALAVGLNVNFATFVRTTSQEHREVVVELWNRLFRTGAVYKGKQEGWYCVADECFYSPHEVKQSPTSSGEMIAQESGRPVQWVSEDNYRFRLHEYIPALQEYLRERQPVQPASRLNDLQPFLERIRGEGMDLSVSRRAGVVGGWGIQVPNSGDDQIIYVWIDALASYLTAAREAGTAGPFHHIIGKDILKFHAVYWPAILIAAGLSDWLPEKIIAHGHWTIDGQKMSKSVGNVVDPLALIRERFNGDSDPLRYFLLRTGRLESDGDFSRQALESCYQRELVGALGNLISRSRVAQAVDATDASASASVSPHESITAAIGKFKENIEMAYGEACFPAVADCLQDLLAEGNRFISQAEPWRWPERWPLCQASIRALLGAVVEGASPLLPTTTERIVNILTAKESLGKGGIFPRLVTPLAV